MGKVIGSMKPVRMWIDGRCFTIQKFKKAKKRLHKNIDNEGGAVASTSCVDDHNFVITPADKGKLATAFRLPPLYYIRLNNFPEFNIKTLESETNTEVTMPKNGNDGYMIITGTNESNIVNAGLHIQSIISEIRDRQPAAQFISIPVHSEEIQRNFEQFKQEILNDEPMEGVDESIFQPGVKLHLTIGVFALMNNSEKEEAISALNDCKTQIIDPFLSDKGSLKIKVCGIGCMNDNLSKVNVLYANARIEHENQDLLQQLANSVSNYFYERGLLKQYQDNVKLHVTLMNTKKRSTSKQNSPVKKHTRWNFKRQTFDARKIMEKFEHFNFGETVFDSIHLSYISSVGEDGFYKPLRIISL